MTAQRRFCLYFGALVFSCLWEIGAFGLVDSLKMENTQILQFSVEFCKIFALSTTKKPAEA